MFRLICVLGLLFANAATIITGTYGVRFSPCIDLSHKLQDMQHLQLDFRKPFQITYFKYLEILFEIFNQLCVVKV